MSKLVLGKGLGALIPGDENKEADAKKYKRVSLNLIEPNPMQPRQDFKEEALNQLAQSLKENGLMQPLVVKPNGNNYIIIAGERRFRASKLAGLTEVPVLMMEDVSDERMLELALIENIQRENLNPIETAEAYRHLLEKCKLTQNELADRVGKSRTAVANTMRLIALPNQIKQYLRDEKITEGHARAILSLEHEADMLKLADQIVNDSLSVRQVEAETTKSKKRRLIPKKNHPAFADVETYLKRLLGTSVKLKPGLKRGKIEIEYYTTDDLDRLLELFKKIEQ